MSYLSAVRAGITCWPFGAAGKIGVFPENSCVGCVSIRIPPLLRRDVSGCDVAICETGTRDVRVSLH